MSRRRKVVATLLAALAFGATCDLAHAEPAPPSDTANAPPYTLDVDSDAPDVVSFEALAARIGADLGMPVVRPQGQAPARAAISIRYRGRELVVRAVHAGGRVLERTVEARGDDAAVQREAVLLAGNLARDEAREILDALATRPPPPTPAAAPAEPKTEPKAEPNVDEGTQPLSGGFVHPLASNYALPNVTTNFNASLLYGRAGRVDGMQFGTGVVYASRHVSGMQLGAFAGAVRGPLEGTQLAGFGNVVTESVSGAQVAGFGNVAMGPLEGTQLSGFGNFANASVSGAQVAGFGNVAMGPLEGTQLSGGANLAWGGYTGIQVAGGANVARGPVKGVAIAGGANVITGETEGMQLASINVADQLDGLQLGVINVGRKVRGLQLGVINVADEVDGASIGVISITRTGIHPIAWTSNLAYLNAGLKFSTKYVYTVGAVHTGTIEGDFHNVGVTAALGGHIPLPANFDIEIQGTVSHLVPRPSQSSKIGNLWLTEELIVGYSLASHFRVFAGGGVRQALKVDLGRDVVRPEVLAGVQF